MAFLHVLLAIMSASLHLSTAEVLLCLRDGICASEGGDMVECRFVNGSEKYVLYGTKLEDGTRHVQEVWKILEKDGLASLSFKKMQYEQTELVCEDKRMLFNVPIKAIGGSPDDDFESVSDVESGPDGLIEGSSDFGSPEPLDPFENTLQSVFGGQDGSGAVAIGGTYGPGASMFGKLVANSAAGTVGIGSSKLGRIGGGSRSCSAQWVSVRGEPRMCCK